MKKYTIGAVIGLILGANFGVWVEGRVHECEVIPVEHRLAKEVGE